MPTTVHNSTEYPIKKMVRVRTGSRLHFGLFSFGKPKEEKQFGGIGAMVDLPQLQLTIRPTDKKAERGIIAKGQESERVLTFAKQALASWNLEIPNCCIEVLVAQKPHHGLGSGTQLALAIASGLRVFLGLPKRPIEQLAQEVGRGKRSSIGLHGFEKGGFLIDDGHSAQEPIGKLRAQQAIPTTWRFLLITLPGPPGLSGNAELKSFDKLPAVPEKVSQTLRKLAIDYLLPAIKKEAFDDFSEHLYQYGRLAGECFSEYQGGPYASEKIASLVTLLRNEGIRGVGQSSWGPTVFALVKESEAIRLAERIHGLSLSKLSLDIAAPLNQSANIVID